MSSQWRELTEGQTTFPPTPRTTLNHTTTTMKKTPLHLIKSIGRSPLRLGFLLVTLALATVLSSCATADFHQYTGAQQNWPIASGAFVTSKYDVPAYYGPPDRPYIMLGSLDATTNRGIGQDEASAVQDAARVAKRMGADAIIVIGSRREQVGTSSFGTVSTQSSGTGGFYGDVVGNSVYGQHLRKQLLHFKYVWFVIWRLSREGVSARY